MKKISVLVPDTSGAKTLSVLRCLGRVPGVEVHVVSSQPQVFKYSKYCKSYHIFPSFEEDERWLERVVDHCREQKIDLIFPTSRSAIHFFIENKALLPSDIGVTPIPDMDSFEIAEDKGHLAYFMMNRGIPCPKTYFFDEQFDNHYQLEEMVFPQLLKVRQGVGGENIFKVESLEMLYQIAEQHSLALEDYILQDYIPEGYDLSFSVLGDKGKIRAYTIWREFNPVEPREKKFKSIVNHLEFMHDEALLKMAARLTRELNWTGLANLNLRYDKRDGQVKMLEINPRVWNSLQGSLFVGVNFPHLVCLMGMGEPFALPAYHDDHFFMNHLLAQIKEREKTKIPYSWKKSSTIYLLQDPLPSILSELQNIKEAVFGKFSKKRSSTVSPEKVKS